MDNDPMGPLLKQLVEQPSVRQFPFFVSHHELCFSFCPDYPYATENLPTVTWLSDQYQVHSWQGQHSGSAEEVALLLESLLLPEVAGIFAGNVDQKVYRDLLGRLECQPPECSAGAGGEPYFGNGSRRCFVSSGYPGVTLHFEEDGQEAATHNLEPARAARAICAWLFGP
jgi:hypothetical protein